MYTYIFISLYLYVRFHISSDVVKSLWYVKRREESGKGAQDIDAYLALLNDRMTPRQHMLSPLEN